MYNKSLLITLGHNSSVLYYDGVNNPIGYEEERLSKKKSDSKFPSLALEKVCSLLSQEQLENATIYISHWFDVFHMSEFPEKYFDYASLYRLVVANKMNIVNVNRTFTHHDAHAYSALTFVENFNKDVAKDMHYLVIDGFGNIGEVISLYTHDGTDKLNRELRVYGYTNSLGLMYQHATAFVGMKENQDEYKFLGYESNIKNVISPDVLKSLDYLISRYVNKKLYSILYTKTVPQDEHRTYLNLTALDEARKYNYDVFQSIIDTFVAKVNVDDDDIKRTIIGYFVQSVLEETVIGIIDNYNIMDLACSGGCFMNVKLNNTILKHIRGKFSVTPLCGDQGAAIGMYRYYTNNIFKYGDLCYGVRDWNTPSTTDLGIIVVNNDSDFIATVSTLLKNNSIVNVFRGNMEFGPRALCNTSTLAKPTVDNVKYINFVNKRNEVMPMAPVIHEVLSNIIMTSTIKKTVGSEKFMIVANDIRQDFCEHMLGAVHNHPINGTFTCRPQVINSIGNPVISSILVNTGEFCLINTSFNTHGQPILFSLEDCINDFAKQKVLDHNNRLNLVIQLPHD